MRSFFKAVLRSHTAMFGWSLLLLLVLLAILGPAIGLPNPVKSDLGARLIPPTWAFADPRFSFPRPSTLGGRVDTQPPGWTVTRWVDSRLTPLRATFSPPRRAGYGVCEGTVDTANTAS